MIDLVYVGFSTQLNNRYSGILNEKEIQLCCLLKANFSTKEINMLTRQSLQTIYQRKTQILQVYPRMDRQFYPERGRCISVGRISAGPHPSMGKGQ